MADLVDRLGAILFDASLAATAIAGFVVLAMVQCRQPARRRTWARAGLIAALALPPITALNPAPRIDLWRSIRAIHPSSVDPPVVQDCHPNGWSRTIGQGLVVAYTAGVSIGLAWMAVGLWGVRRLVGRARMPSGPTAALYDSMPFDRGGIKPRLLVSGRASRAVLLGLMRPAILIPTELDEIESVEGLRVSLLHELAHAEARDHLASTLGTLAQAVWFFLPPVWWVRDQMRLDQEFLADDRAAARFKTSGHYASSLLDLAVEHSSKAAGLASKGAVPTSTGGTSALIQRVLMLMKCPFAIENQPPTWWWWSTSLFVAIATVTASCLTLRGLADAFDVPRAPAVEPSRTFAIARLDIDKQAEGAPPFDLRVRLPERFSMNLEVMAEPAELLELEILGHRLGPSIDKPTNAAGFQLWHRVEIHRSDGRESILVDGSSVGPIDRPNKLSTWLTIRALPGRATRVRNLNLTW